MSLVTLFGANRNVVGAILPGLLCAFLLLAGITLASLSLASFSANDTSELTVDAATIDKSSVQADYPWQLELTDSDGQVIELSDYQGRTLLLSFFYANCGYACPIQTARLAQVQKQLKAQSLAASRFVSVSIHPKRDTPRVMDTFKRPYDINAAHWQFGAPTNSDELNQLLLKAGISTEAVAGLAQTDHTMKILLINPAGKVMQRYVGDKFNIKRVANEVETLVRLSSRS